MNMPKMNHVLYYERRVYILNAKSFGLNVNSGPRNWAITSGSNEKLDASQPLPPVHPASFVKPISPAREPLPVSGEVQGVT